MQIKGLYLVTIEDINNTHVKIAEEAVKAGVRIVQYREKEKAFDDMVKDCAQIKNLCEQYNAVFIVNDNIELAIATRADGIHLGQDDSHISKAINKMPGKIIGISVSTAEEAIEAQNNGAGYIGAGPVFTTPTKKDALPPIGLDKLKSICDTTSIPVIAIGGIGKSNAEEVYEAGAAGIAVISAITSAKDMGEAAKELLRVSEPFI